MAKIKSYETKTDIVFYYTTEEIQSIDSLSRWLSEVKLLKELTIERVQLINTSSRNSEGGGGFDVSVNDAAERLSEHISETHANLIIIGTEYFGVYMALVVDLKDWVCSIATNKKNIEALNQLAQLLNFED